MQPSKHATVDLYSIWACLHLLRELQLSPKLDRLRLCLLQPPQRVLREVAS